jgi:uncharacterized protein (DUF2384 family)
MAKTPVAKNRGPKTNEHATPRAATAKHSHTGENGAKRAASSSGRKSIEELAAEQGIRPTRLDDVLGKGADLWESDRDLEQFVEDIYARRSEPRELAKQ